MPKVKNEIVNQSSWSWALGITLVLLLVLYAGPWSRQAEAGLDNGLEAEYFDNGDLTNSKVSRTDPQIDFSWGKGSPDPSIDPDTFSARWTGLIEAPSTGTYTFYVKASDGIRLRVDGELIIDRWKDQKKVKERSGTIDLEQNERYEIELEYYENKGSAAAQLRWSGPDLAKQPVPVERLFLPGAAPPPPPPPPPPPSGNVERWSEPETWGGEVPRAGEAVTIPEEKTVLLDQSTPPLGSLQIDGTLVFEDNYHDLTSDSVLVHGTLQVGTEEEPITSKARITLTGNDRNKDVMGMGPKILGVMGGTLDVHGADRSGWTRLNATAQKGSNKLTLENNPGWQPGDRIAISSTDYDPLQVDEATITSVSGNTVTLGKTLAYTHWGEKQTFDEQTVDERAEVALLSRNVEIEGEEDSSADGFGGQVMVMSGGQARIEGAELTRMGQKGILRRYPVHFHMLGDSGEGSYLKNSSLHHTNNRCVTVHGTNKLDISNNVCYDHVGHGFFLEDGAETDNVLDGNLGFATREPAETERLLASDRSPATFWITNPDNVVRNNVAGGSQGKGFWYAFPEHPTGLFASTNPSEAAKIWPRRTPLGESSGNIAHSNDETGLFVDDGPKADGTNTEGTNYDPRENPTPPASGESDSDPVVANFTDFTGYKNRYRGVWLRGENHRLVGATLADNSTGATFASDESFLQDSLVVGETANLGNPRSWETKGEDGRALPRPWEADFPIRGFEFYDGRVGTEDTTFVNFQANDQREASGLGVQLKNAFGMHPQNYASGLRFVNSKRVYMPDPTNGYDGDHSAVFIDRTGSVTGTSGAVVTANNPFLTNEDCAFDTGSNTYICPPETEFVSLISYALDGGSTKVKPLTITRESDRQSQTLMGCCSNSTDALTNLFTDEKYKVAFNGGTPTKLRFTLYRGGENQTRWLRLSIPYASTPKVTKYGCDLAGTTSWCKGKATSLADLDAKTVSSYYYDSTAKQLYLKLYSNNTNWEELRVEPSP